MYQGADPDGKGLFGKVCPLYSIEAVSRELCINDRDAVWDNE